MSKNWIIFLVVIVLIGLGYWYVAPKSAHAPTASEHKVFTISVENGKIVSGPALLTATQGDTVTMNITLDVDGEVHLHGYNKMVELKAGVPGSLSFLADTAGNFPFENEDTKTDLGALQVMPK